MAIAVAIYCSQLEGDLNHIAKKFLLQSDRSLE